MNTVALYAGLFGGGAGVLGLAVFLVIRYLRKSGADEAKAQINADNAAHAQRQADVLQKEVTNDDVEKSLRDGTF